MRSIEVLTQAVRAEATRAEFPVDAPVYERAGKDPLEPILFAGSLESSICVLGRDLGKDEVAAGEPLIGAGGRLVRSELYRAATGSEPAARDRRLEPALSIAMLTNTVPYKPPGNKAYPARVKERFRPFVAELIGAHWRGDRVITLGTEAFQWFGPYTSAGRMDEFWSRPDRYEAELPEIVLEVQTLEGSIRKAVTLLPLPHPSPLNQRWYGLFPALLRNRLATCGFGAS